MAVAHRSLSSVGYGTRANTGLAVPTGTTDGDILLFILFIGADPSDVTATPPSGYTAVSGYTDGVIVVRQGSDSFVNTRMRIYAWWKRASGESGTHTTTHASAGAAAYLGAYSGGISSGDPTDNPIPSTNSGTGSSQTIVASTVTTAVDGSMVVFCCATWEGSAATSPPAGTTPTFTERVESFGNAFYVADGALTTAGATGNKSPSTVSSQNAWGATLIVIEPDVTVLGSGQPAIKRGGGIPFMVGGPQFAGFGGRW